MPNWIIIGGSRPPVAPPGLVVSDYDKATFDLNDTAVGVDVCPPVAVRRAGIAVEMAIVAKRNLPTDLTVLCKKNGTSIGTITLPAHTAAYTVVTNPTFAMDSPVVALGEVWTVDITSSDGSADAKGVATVAIKWRLADAS